MFFTFSKILLFLIKPMVWVVFIMLRAAFTKDEYKRKRRIIVSLILLYLFSNAFLINELGLLYEDHSSRQLDSTTYDYAIVLGGYASIDKKDNITTFSETSDRLWQAIRLLKMNKVKHLIISGGSGHLTNPKTKEAIVVKKYLNEIDIPDSLVIIESNSRNTFENATNSFKLLDSLKSKTKVLVITSAWHVPRAKLCFENNERTVDFYSTNHLFSKIRDKSPENILVPSSKALYSFELLVKEWIGYVVYLIK